MKTSKEKRPAVDLPEILQGVVTSYDENRKIGFIRVHGRFSRTKKTEVIFHGAPPHNASQETLRVDDKVIFTLSGTMPVGGYELAKFVSKDEKRSHEYPYVVQEEEKRWQVIQDYELFVRPIPCPRIEKCLENWCAYFGSEGFRTSFTLEELLKKSVFRPVALYVTVFGKESYRTISVHKFNRENDCNVLEHAKSLSKFAEFGSKCLSACQYVAELGETLEFRKNDTRPLPFVELMRNNFEWFDRLMQHSDPLYKQYKADAERRGVWNAVKNQLLGKPTEEKIEEKDLVNMFEVFAYYGLEYVGAPIFLEGHVVGVVCLLYEGEQYITPKYLIEAVAADIESCFKMNYRKRKRNEVE